MGLVLELSWSQNNPRSVLSFLFSKRVHYSGIIRSQNIDSSPMKPCEPYILFFGEDFAYKFNFFNKYWTIQMHEFLFYICYYVFCQNCFPFSLVCQIFWHKVYNILLLSFVPVRSVEKSGPFFHV